MKLEDKSFFGYLIDQGGYKTKVHCVQLSDAQEAIEEAEIRQKKRYRKEIKELKKELDKFKGEFKAHIFPF
jgi:sugar-specific transcriptional regulator TrmB